MLTPQHHTLYADALSCLEERTPTAEAKPSDTATGQKARRHRWDQDKA